jgi:hypothetical protein
MTIEITVVTVLVAVGPGHPDIQWASIAIIFIFLFTFGYAWQGCVWLYCSEIAPLEYRHIGAAATAFGEWLMTFITVFAGRECKPAVVKLAFETDVMYSNRLR